MRVPLYDLATELIKETSDEQRSTALLIASGGPAGETGCDDMK